MLEKVKKYLGITGNFQDDTIQGYIDEVINFMLSGGVEEDVVYSNKAVGVIARGVMDLWDYGVGGTNLSPYFIQRVTQLALKPNDNDLNKTVNLLQNVVNNLCEEVKSLKISISDIQEKLDEYTKP